ncbi:MAG: hypothetical protein IIY21_04255 [Clostridiales bacterium]|nr:hypothetical protein [Clostridiales bacterium]MBQ1573902.1 hypothetical protein [Clostridiales bacterium]
MMVIITGENRVEICVPNRRQEGLHFFKTRNQLYKIFPDGLRRVRIFDYGGKEIGSEEGIIFAENCTRPYDEMNIDYSMDRLLSDVDRHKMMRPTNSLGFNKDKAIWFANAARGLFNKVGLTGVIVACVVIYAFVMPMLG